MKVFVTGGHGGIGSAVCEKFAREGYEVTAPGSKELDLSDLAAVKTTLPRGTAVSTPSFIAPATIRRSRSKIPRSKSLTAPRTST